MEKLKLNGFKIIQKNHDPEKQPEKTPEFIFIENSGLNSNYACFGVDLKLDEILIDKYKGKMISFNKRVLEINKNRQFIVSLVTNLSVIHLVISQKRDGQIVHSISSNPWDFWTLGLMYLQVVLDEPKLVGYDDSFNYSIEIDKYILILFKFW